MSKTVKTSDGAELMENYVRRPDRGYPITHDLEL